MPTVIRDTPIKPLTGQLKLFGIFLETKHINVIHEVACLPSNPATKGLRVWARNKLSNEWVLSWSLASSLYNTSMVLSKQRKASWQCSSEHVLQIKQHTMLSVNCLLERHTEAHSDLMSIWTEDSIICLLSKIVTETENPF